MGIVSHHAIVVVGTYGDFAEKAHAMAVSTFGEDMVSGLSAEMVNGTRSFCVFPDGSKEGWQESANGDLARDVFVKWLHSLRYSDGSSPLTWAEVEMGERGSPRGNEGASVRRHFAQRAAARGTT